MNSGLNVLERSSLVTILDTFSSVLLVLSLIVLREVRTNLSFMSMTFMTGLTKSSALSYFVLTVESPWQSLEDS